MVFDILKKDLKRKKTMNLILLLFIVLATVFVSSSVNNIVTVLNGTDYYFEQAGLGDYLILTMGADSVGSLDPVFEKGEGIRDYRLETAVFASKDKFSIDGKNIEFKNTALLQSLEDTSLHFFNEKNEIVDHVETGKVYVTGDFMKKNGLKVGDQIRIRHESVDKTLTIEGRLKDAFLGSSFMGNIRFLMSREDYQDFEADEVLKEYYRGQVCYVDVTDLKKFEKALSGTENMAFNKPASLIAQCYMMDMVIAGILLVVSICLIVVSFVVLKFTITFTLTEEFREIGVMKAIGIKNAKIRSLYVTKYLAIAVVGAVIGLFGSIPFSNLLLESVSTNLVLGNTAGVSLNVVSAIVVIVIVSAYAYLCTGKVKKYSPIDAIRSGQTGERFQKKSMYRLGKSKQSTSGYLAWNDILSSPKKYITIVIAFFICSLLVLVLVNTTVTMQSESLVTSFSKKTDVYIDDVGKSMSSMVGEGHEGMEDSLRWYEEKLEENGMPAKGCVDVQYKYDVEFEGEAYQLSFQQGINTLASEYEYYQGLAPSNRYEIAITEMVSKKLDAKIGDSIRITINGEKEEYLITAYFQSMNLLGEIIRLHEDVPTNLSESSSALAFQFDFYDHPNHKEIANRVEKMKDIFENEDIYDAAGYTADCIGVVDTMLAVEYLLVLITVIVVILVTVLMERSFISEEKGEIAILKAIGFRDKTILAWHMKRFMIVAMAAVLLAIVLSVPATHLCISPIFGSMGMHQMHYEFDYVQILLIFPAIILVVTMLAAYLTGLYINKIKSRDTASIE